MSKPTIEQLAIQNADLKKEIDALIGQLKTKDKHFKEEHKRQGMIKRMLISSGRITNEDFDLLERIVAPLDQ